MRCYFDKELSHYFCTKTDEAAAHVHKTARPVLSLRIWISRAAKTPEEFLKLLIYPDPRSFFHVQLGYCQSEKGKYAACF